jgi:hypothetical protein
MFPTGKKRCWRRMRLKVSFLLQEGERIRGRKEGDTHDATADEQWNINKRIH